MGAPLLVAETVLEEAAVQILRAPDEPFDDAEIEAIVADMGHLTQGAPLREVLSRIATTYPK